MVLVRRVRCVASCTVLTLASIFCRSRCVRRLGLGPTRAAISTSIEAPPTAALGSRDRAPGFGTLSMDLNATFERGRGRATLRAAGMETSFLICDRPYLKLCQMVFWPNMSVVQSDSLTVLVTCNPLQSGKRHQVYIVSLFFTIFFRGFWAYFRLFAIAYPGTQRRFKTLS